MSEELRAYVRDNAAAAMVVVRDYLRALADDDELATSALLAQEAADYLPQGERARISRDYLQLTPEQCRMFANALGTGEALEVVDTAVYEDDGIGLTVRVGGTEARFGTWRRHGRWYVGPIRPPKAVDRIRRSVRHRVDGNPDIVVDVPKG